MQFSNGLFYWKLGSLFTHRKEMKKSKNPFPIHNL